MVDISFADKVQGVVHYWKQVARGEKKTDAALNAAEWNGMSDGRLRLFVRQEDEGGIAALAPKGSALIVAARMVCRCHRSRRRCFIEQWQRRKVRRLSASSLQRLVWVRTTLQRSTDFSSTTVRPSVQSLCSRRKLQVTLAGL